MARGIAPRAGMVQAGLAGGPLHLLCTLLTLFGSVIAAASSSESNRETGDQPPHIVFMLIDDYGHTDIGYHNQKYDNLLRTPHLDTLAATGIKLEQYYVQPVCTPTRSQLMTGMYQIHTGLQHGVIHPQQPYGLSTNISLMSNHLVDRGYVAHKVGKWHLGFYTEGHCPWKRGFGNGPHGNGGSDFGYLGGEEDYYTHVRDPGYDFRVGGIPDHDYATTEHGSPDKYSTKLFRERAVNIIVNHSKHWSSIPLFLYLPSAPYWQKQFELDDFNGDNDRWIYAAMVLEMDHAVGCVVNATRDFDLYSKTIFILSADNGGIQKGGGYNWPMRGEKATLWEGGARAVGFVHSALLKTVGFEYHGLVHVSDWLPSLYHLAGGDILDGIDGIDVWEAIITNGTSPRKELLHNIDMLKGGDAGLPFGSASLRVGDMKIILGRPGADKHFIPPGCTPSVCVPPVMPTGPECVADTNGTHTWLFNISSDPLELCNLAVSQPDTVATMIKRLKYYNETAVPALCPPNDPASNPVGANRSSDPREWGSWGPWRPDS